MLERWLAEVFTSPDGLTLLGIVGRSAIIYLLLVAGMRVLGNREIGRLNAYDFAFVVIIANAIQNATVGGDQSLAGGLMSALTLLVMNQIYTWLITRFPWLEKHMVGEPVVLISDGHVRRKALEREGVTRDELMAALREHGLSDIGDIRLAVLEVDGDISVVPSESRVHRHHRRFRGRV